MIMQLEWAVAGRPCTGERASGDGHVVEPFPNGVLVAVVDALGHGEEAAITARRAEQVLRQHAQETVPALVTACHRHLRAERGAVMSLASFNDREATMTWGGVGNVEGFLVRSAASTLPQREALLLHNGVVGFQLPAVRTTTLRVSPGDLLIFASDGIDRGFLQEFRRATPRQIADDILARYGKPSDDALVLVASYLGIG